MKKIKAIIIVASVAISISLLTNGCSTTKGIVAKAGDQLWAENCVRCHNAPPSSAFNSDQWEDISTHMRLRANLTQEESDKIVAFLQGK